MNRVLGAVALTAIVLLNSRGTAGEIRVLASFLPLYCFAANVAGDAARVDCMVSGNANPHDYQLSARERSGAIAAELIVLNGLGMVNWVHSVLRGADQKKRILPVGSELTNDWIRLSGV